MSFAPSKFMFSQLLSTVEVPHSPLASHKTLSSTPEQFAILSRMSLLGHSEGSTLFKQTPQLSYPASQREHGKAAEVDSASSSSCGRMVSGFLGVVAFVRLGGCCAARTDTSRVLVEVT